MGHRKKLEHGVDMRRCVYCVHNGSAGTGWFWPGCVQFSLEMMMRRPWGRAKGAVRVVSGAWGYVILMSSFSSCSSSFFTNLPLTRMRVLAKSFRTPYFTHLATAKRGSKANAPNMQPPKKGIGEPRLGAQS